MTPVGRVPALAVLAALAIAAALITPAAAAPAEASDNIKRVWKLPFEGGSEIAFQDGLAFALQWGGNSPGVHIFDPKPDKPRRVGFFPCRQTWSEVETVKPGVIAVNGDCATGAGMYFVDVSRPTKPRIIGFIDVPNFIHTSTAFPGEPVIYTSANGCCGDGEGGKEYIIDASDPRKPTIRSHMFYGIGCHDVAFSVGKAHALAACAGGSETQIWDVSDPLRPKNLSRIFNGAFFHHSTALSSDGQMLAVGDEAHGVTTCGYNAPTGALWLYNIEDPASPELVGYYGAQRGSVVSSFWDNPHDWCTVHMYEFIPKTREMVIAWWDGGISVVDFSDPGSPKEIAYYREAGDNVWSAYWRHGRIWTADYNTHGVEAYELR